MAAATAEDYTSGGFGRAGAAERRRGCRALLGRGRYQVRTRSVSTWTKPEPG